MVVVLCGVIVSSVLCLVCAQSDTCGTSVVPLVTRGRPIVRGEYPWLAALYQVDSESGKWSQFCGGALISRRTVITAAHCLVFDSEVVKVENVRVGLGKLYRDFYRKEDYAIIANVTAVVVPPRYYGTLSNYAFDVGLLKLNINVETSAYVLPVCLELETITSVRNGAIVHAAGWGTSEDGTSTDRALAADMSYQNYRACLVQVQLTYRNYVTPDKICSLNTKGSQVDRGDSGGALTFSKNNRHFVIGVVSTKIKSQTAFSIFTDLSNPEIHIWLKEQTAILNALEDYIEGVLIFFDRWDAYKTTVGSSKEKPSIEKLELGRISNLPEVDCATGSLYWSLSDGGSIYKGNVDSQYDIDTKTYTSTENFTFGAIDLFLGHTVDWIGRKLYYLDDIELRNLALIAVNIDSGRDEMIVSNIKTKTVNPVVHPTMRKIYLVTDYKRVDSIDLNSRSPKLTLFHAEQSEEVYDLAIDWQTNDLCWLGGQGRSTILIKCKNLVTEAVRTVFSYSPRFYTDYYKPKGLLITPYNYYWSNFTVIRRVSKSSYRLDPDFGIINPTQVFSEMFGGIHILPEKCPTLTPAPS